MNPSLVTKQIEKRVLDMVHDAAEDVAQSGQKLISDAAPIDTGKLRRSIDGKVFRYGQKVTVVFVANVPYAAVQDLGIQKPKSGPNAGKMIKFENHPGGGGKGYMTNTFNNNIRRWEQEVAHKMRMKNR